VDRQTILAKPFWNDFHHALCITTIVKSDHEIIRITNEEGTAAVAGRFRRDQGRKTLGMVVWGLFDPGRDIIRA